ncbi:hypothetical protein LTR95_007745 [Oleoguttula sp. CCFEE 5521]
MLPCAPDLGNPTDVDWWCADASKNTTWCSGAPVKYGAGATIDTIANGTLAANQPNQPGKVPKGLAIGLGTGLGIVLLALLATVGTSMSIIGKEKKKRAAAEALHTRSQNQAQRMAQDFQMMESPSSTGYKVAPTISEFHGHGLAAELADFGRRGELP